jgi:hypothetical protein
MSWQYSVDPATSNNDAVRFLTGQTSSGDDVLLYDEEIAYSLTQTGSNVQYAAAMCCESMAAQYIRKMQQLGVGSYKEVWGDRVQSLRDQAKTLRQRALLEGVSPFAGGVSKADKRTREDDDDRVQPFARTGHMDYREQSTGST